MLLAAALGALAVYAGRKGVRRKALAARQKDTPVAQLRRELTGALDDAHADPEHIHATLKRAAGSLPSLRDALAKGHDDPAVLEDITDVLALLSPSRRGLQAAICEAGCLPPLIRLLASACQGACESQLEEGASRDCLPPYARTLSASISRTSSTASSVGYGSHSSNSNNSKSVGAAGAAGSVTGAPTVTANVLRTLVNLTSSRNSNTVRQAVLRDDAALHALLQLLAAAPAPLIQQHLAHLHTGPVPGGRSPHGGETGAAHAAVAASSSQGYHHVCDGYFHQQQLQVRWQLAGLAAWLVAHLCSSPLGQLQLVQQGYMYGQLYEHGSEQEYGKVSGAGEGSADEGRCEEQSGQGEQACSGGVVGLLVVLVRRGRLALEAAVAARDPQLEFHTTCEEEEQQGPEFGHGKEGRREDVRRRSSSSSSSSCRSGQRWRRQQQQDGGNTEPEGGSAGGCAVLPYALAATKYGLMALVNATYEHSGNQRAVAEAGALRELDALLGELLLLQHSHVTHTAHGVQQGRAQQHQQQGQGQGQLVCGLLADVSKLGVWLLAHLSSSDPDLKATVAGPGFFFVPKLLAFLLMPHLQHPVPPPQPHPDAAPTDTEDGEEGTTAGGPGAAAAETQMYYVPSATCLAVRQYAAMALVNLTCGVPSTKAAVAASMDWAAMAALLEWLAAPLRDASDSHSAAASAAAEAANSTADLLTYTVWLLQHLSLSPLAAGATDPWVVAPLVTVLRHAGDPHVRLRAVAAAGALCATPATWHRAAFLVAGGLEELLATLHAERDEHLQAYGMLCLAAAVGDDDAEAVAAAVGGGALALVQRLMASTHPACLVPAAEALQALARALLNGVRAAAQSQPQTPSASGVDNDAGHGARESDPWHRPALDSAAAAAIAAVAAEHVPPALLSRVVHVMLTVDDPRVRGAMNDALGALAALPGVRQRYCAAFAETLRELVVSAEVELRVVPVN